MIGTHDEERPPAATALPARRAVITGAGVISALGIGVDPLVAGLAAGKVGIRHHNGRVKESAEATRGGFVEPFSARDIDRRLDLKPMNPVSRFATAAARLALDDAKIRVSPKAGKDTGVINGVYVGTSEEDYMMAVMASDGAQADIAAFSSMVPNATAGWVSNALVLKGYSSTVTMGADAGLFAVGFARMAVRGGLAPRILAGAADELSSRYFLNYDQLGLLYRGQEEEDYRIRKDCEDCRVLGEGAAYLLVEDLEAARSATRRSWRRSSGSARPPTPRTFHSRAPPEQACARPWRWLSRRPAGGPRTWSWSPGPPTATTGIWERSPPSSPPSAGEESCRS